LGKNILLGGPCVLQLSFALCFQRDSKRPRIAMAVVDLSTFASVTLDLDPGLGLNVVEIPRQGFIDVLTHVFRDVAAEAFCVQTRSKPAIYSEFALQSMCDNSTNLDLIAIGLKILDQ